MKYENISESLYIKGRIGWKGLKKGEYLKTGDYRIINGSNISNGVIDWSNCGYITKQRYFESPEIMLKKGDILITKDGTIGKVAIVNKLEYPSTIASGLFILRNNVPEKWNTLFLYYYLQTNRFKEFIHSRTEGSVIPHLYQKDFENLEIPYISLTEQYKISSKLDLIQRKISLNRQINDNLLELAKAVFNKNVNSCSKTLLSNYFLPKRGKNLVKKNVIPGAIPVIAGGMIPAAFHNKSNTMAPVITISASGANAGYVQIWGIRVWSSDSSFIDESVSNNIYFWYLLLKKYQKQIYESQTGSAQPHIYPKNIGNLLIPVVSDETRLNINEKVKPIFNNIFKNKHENNLLNNLKIILLEKYF